MPGKDDPLESSRPPTRVTLWLNRENSAEACDNYWQAYREYANVPDLPSFRQQWDIAWAAAVAATDYVFSGKVTPR